MKNIIPKSHLSKFLGQLVHIVWANPACVWRLESINSDSAVLKTPKTGKTLIVSINELIPTKNNAHYLDRKP